MYVCSCVHVLTDRNPFGTICISLSIHTFGILSIIFSILVAVVVVSALLVLQLVVPSAGNWGAVQVDPVVGHSFCGTFSDDDHTMDTLSKPGSGTSTC